MYEVEREALIQAFQDLGYKVERLNGNTLVQKRFNDNNTFLYIREWEVKMEFTQYRAIPKRRKYNNYTGWKTIYWGTYDDMFIEEDGSVNLRVGQFKFMKFRRDRYYIYIDVARGMNGKEWRICHKEQAQ